MSRKRQQNQNYSPPGEGSKSQNEGPSKQSKPHSAPATPKRPPIWGASSSREARASKSTPLLEDGEGVVAPNAKVAIPRQTPGNTPRFNRRVPRACESCRTRKTKCSGDTPVCRQCRELRATCQYPVGWREKMKNDVDRLTAELQEYENFVNDLRNSAENHTADWIKGLIDKHGLRGNHSFENPPSQLSTPHNELDGDEGSPISSIGSLNAIDRVEEDLNRTKHTRATGYMGKSSEISWMQRLQREAEQRARGNPGALDSTTTDEEDAASDRFSLHALNYHLDDLEISVAEPVQRYSMPSRQLAHRLFDEYLKTVHPFFPIISKPLFRAQFQTFFDSSGRYSAARPSNKWLAILNTIFAIAAKHAHLIHAPWRGEENDHLIYLDRARQLSMNGEVLFSHPDLQQVQVEGLIAFYLLTSDQINRAWRISALAVRSAITLGINLKIDTPKTPNVAKEARYRVWWCLYSFEHMLGIMTGRAIYSLDGGYATPLPLPFEEEQLQEDPEAVKLLNDPASRDEQISILMASTGIRQSGNKDDVQKCRSRDRTWLKNMPSNSGLCYLYYCDLTVITQEIVNKVFSTNAVSLMWSEIEARLDELLARVDLWHSSLPAALDFTQEEADDNPDQLRYKLFLAFHYYGARITLGRPCLCRRDAGLSNTNQTFSHMMAVIALNSASGMLDLIPDEPNVMQLYKLCPWWCVLRYLMQAATVILLELSFGSVHMPEEELKLVKLSKKCIRWFHAMSERSIGSRRAWQLCDSIFRKLASGMKYNTDDIPSKPQQRQIIDEESSSGNINFFGPAIPSEQRSYFNINEEDTSMFGPRPPTEEDIWTNYFNLPTPDFMPSVQGHPHHSHIPDDTYFPYDPLGEDFMRSLFPSSEEENRELPN